MCSDFPKTVNALRAIVWNFGLWPVWLGDVGVNLTQSTGLSGLPLTVDHYSPERQWEQRFYPSETVLAPDWGLAFSGEVWRTNTCQWTLKFEFCWRNKWSGDISKTGKFRHWKVDNTKLYKFWAPRQSNINSTQTWGRPCIRVQDGKPSQLLGYYCIMTAIFSHLRYSHRENWNYFK